MGDLKAMVDEVFADVIHPSMLVAVLYALDLGMCPSCVRQRLAVGSVCWHVSPLTGREVRELGLSIEDD